MTEAARKKFTITKESVASSAARDSSRFLASFDATGLDRAAVAAALRALADAVEAPLRLEATAAALRARLEAADPTLTVGTRIAPPAPDESYPISVAGAVLGSASFVTLRAPKPLAVRKLERKRDLRHRHVDNNPALNLSMPPLPEPPDDEDKDWREREYDEDDDVEFNRHDQWHDGTIIDKASPFTYIVEDKHGRRWEVNRVAIRPPEGNF